MHTFYARILLMMAFINPEKFCTVYIRLSKSHLKLLKQNRILDRGILLKKHLIISGKWCNNAQVAEIP